MPADGGGGGGGEIGGGAPPAEIGIGGTDIPLFEAEALGGGAGGGTVAAGIEGFGIPLLDAEALGGWGILPCGIDGVSAPDFELLIDGIDGFDGVVNTAVVTEQAMHDAAGGNPKEGSQICNQSRKVFP